MRRDPTGVVRLPEPSLKGDTSFEAAVAARRSVRAFAAEPVSLEQLAQLLWAAQGITGPEGKRAAPSAGATYPLEILVVAGQVGGLAAGVYRYRAGDHALTPVLPGDRRANVVGAKSSRSAWVAEAAVILALAAVPERTTCRYGERAIRYVHMEVGAVSENLHLQAVTLGLGTTFVGAFDDDRMSQAVGAGPDERVLAVFPVGVPR